MAYVIAKHTPVGADGKLDKAAAMWSVVDGQRTAFSANRQSAAIAFKRDMDEVLAAVLAPGGQILVASIENLEGLFSKRHAPKAGPVKAPEPVK